MLRFLEREGFILVRIRGSHHMLSRSDLDTVVPVHGNRALPVGTLRKILRDIDMLPDDFEQRYHA
jgi:predicted RNA binding protein YcfA (HicA-like mRNA interferase family)